jgi:hypothetical protein
MEREDLLLIESLERRFGGLQQFVPVLEKCANLEAWHSNVIGAIPLRARLNFSHLKIAAGAGYEYLGWSSRNLLELLVWALYVTASKEKARRFFEDYIIDTEDLIVHLRCLLRTICDSSHPAVQYQVELLAQQGALLEQERERSCLSRQSKYLGSGRIAKEVGMGERFSSINRILSKVTHPTSLSILLALPPNADASLRTFILKMGLVSAKDCMDVMCEHYDQLGIDTHLIQDVGFSYSLSLRGE